MTSTFGSRAFTWINIIYVRGIFLWNTHNVTYPASDNSNLCDFVVYLSNNLTNDLIWEYVLNTVHTLHQRHTTYTYLLSVNVITNKRWRRKPLVSYQCKCWNKCYLKFGSQLFLLSVRNFSFLLEFFVSSIIGLSRTYILGDEDAIFWCFLFNRWTRWFCSIKEVLFSLEILYEVVFLSKTHWPRYFCTAKDQTDFPKNSIPFSYRMLESSQYSSSDEI